MANSTIEQYLPLTAAYIDWVFEKEGEQRCGHHNYVVEQNICNTSPALIHKSRVEIMEYDTQQLNYLRALDENACCVLTVGESTFDEFAEICDIYGQGCNYPTKRGVQGFQVDFEVVAFVGDERRDFTVIYQSGERTCNITAYNGFEMSCAIGFGCDADESPKLLAFIDHDSDRITHIKFRAEQLCKAWFEINDEA